MTSVKFDVLIIGAGAYGLSCAWWMAKRRTGARILVVDEGEFASGASGRNGAGFRMQWGLDLNIRLCQESIRFFETAADQLDYPRGIELKQDGYLVLAHSEKALATLRSSLEIQHRYGVPSELLDADDCIQMVPALGRNRLVGGTFCGKDGTISPFLLLDSLLKACRRENVDIRYGTRVEKLERTNGNFSATVSGGTIEADKVLLCTDWAVPELLASFGITLPVKSLPKEAIVTVPCAPKVKPILISLEHHISVNQVSRGSIIFVVSRAREGKELVSTPDFLGFAAPKIVDLLPGVADVPVLRTWGGVSSLTPDMQPILGETEVEGLYVAVSSFRGLMTSPAVGRIMSALILESDTNDPVLTQLTPRRFQTGDLIIEPLLNQE
ncbi:MAG TPA: FAD-binding oxidoreductase [Stellaceae bacterium]|jgi:sarcosine oxidase subunit beta|nr:FAD-binding oxidoreductase [Stellaceae bacterium]